MITGEYNAMLYVILQDGEEVYAAGNSRFESQGYLPAPDGVGLRTMRRFCISTAHEFAEELGETYGGVSRNDDLE